MSKLKEGSWRKLYDRNERATAKLAMKARCNTFFGGASALVVARRMDAMGCEINAQAIVADVYHNRCSQHLPYKCPECGSTRLGQDAAYMCCTGDTRDDDN